jgi:hypothetical protein
MGSYLQNNLDGNVTVRMVTFLFLFRKELDFTALLDEF